LCCIPKYNIDILAIHRRGKRARKPTQKMQIAEVIQTQGKGKATQSKGVKKAKK
jgi:hypothetical protein